MICRMSQGVVHEFLHLTTINPYMTSALAAGGPAILPGHTESKALRAHAARQQSGVPPAGLSPDNVGISAFAFQGTNAHVILIG